MSSSVASTKRESHPVSLQDSHLADVFTHVHPFLIVSWYAIQFKATVADPVTSLASLLLPVVATQIFYVILCLPAVGTGASLAKSGGVSKSSAAAKKVTPGKKFTTALFSTLLSLLLGTPLLTLILVLFGAPVTTHLPNTTLCAAHIAILAGLPLIYIHGVDNENWRKVGALLLPIDEVFGAAVGTIVGAWLGAVPIPLDWDREWQKWPVTIVTGAYLGWAIGKFAGRYIFHGKTIDLSA